MEKEKEQAIEILRATAEKWPSKLITRKEVQKFTGGIYSAGYLANCDSRGIGPSGSFSIGRKRCYSVDELVKWLIDKVEV